MNLWQSYNCSRLNLRIQFRLVTINTNQKPEISGTQGIDCFYKKVET